MQELSVAFDAFVGADGAAGWAFVVAGGHEDFGALPRGTASHLAEWEAAWRAISWLTDHVEGPARVALRTDSALVAKGLASRRPAMHGEAATIRAECRKALARLGERGVRVAVARVPREENAAADALSRRGAGE